MHFIRFLTLLLQSRSRCAAPNNTLLYRRINGAFDTNKLHQRNSSRRLPPHHLCTLYI